MERTKSELQRMYPLPVPFMDIENAIKSSVGTTFPVFSVSNTLNRLLITTSASHLKTVLEQINMLEIQTLGKS